VARYCECDTDCIVGKGNQKAVFDQLKRTSCNLKKFGEVGQGFCGKDSVARRGECRQVVRDGNTHIGFLAQELDEVLPEVVRKPVGRQASADDARTVNPQDDVYAVNYSEIIPVLVKAIQEQQEIIRQLEERIVKMENK